MRQRTFLVLIASTVIVATIAIVLSLWLKSNEFDRCYVRIKGGMTVDQIRDLVGREEDSQDLRPTITGEFERSWSFSDGGRITVVFGPNGRSIYKEIAPVDCGVTPLMGEYVDPKKDVD